MTPGEWANFTKTIAEETEFHTLNEEFHEGASASLEYHSEKL
jgi:hypothetical protein